MSTWYVTTAKAQFRTMLDKAETEGPQLITRRKQQFYILTKEQWDAFEGTAPAMPDISPHLRPLKDRQDL